MQATRSMGSNSSFPTRGRRAEHSQEAERITCRLNHVFLKHIPGDGTVCHLHQIVILVPHPSRDSGILKIKSQPLAWVRHDPRRFTCFRRPHFCPRQGLFESLWIIWRLTLFANHLDTIRPKTAHKKVDHNPPSGTLQMTFGRANARLRKSMTSLVMFWPASGRRQSRSSALAGKLNGRLVSQSACAMDGLDCLCGHLSHHWRSVFGCHPARICPPKRQL